jgi:hypothetical protein
MNPIRPATCKQPMTTCSSKQQKHSISNPCISSHRLHIGSSETAAAPQATVGGVHRTLTSSKLLHIQGMYAGMVGNVSLTAATMSQMTIHSRPDMQAVF